MMLFMFMGVVMRVRSKLLMDRERIKMFVMDCMFLFLYIVIKINMLFISEIKIIIEYRVMRMVLEVEEIFGLVILWL